MLARTARSASNPHSVPLVPDLPVPRLGLAVRHFAAGALELLREKFVVRLSILTPSTEANIFFCGSNIFFTYITSLKAFVVVIRKNKRNHMPPTGKMGWLA